MFRLKYILDEQRNVTKINFGNVPKKIFNFAYTNGGRAFTIKTIRPGIPNLSIDIIKTISNSNSIGATSSYGKDHVFIISADLASNTSKDIRNVIILPLSRFELFTKISTDAAGNPLEIYPEYDVLKSPIGTIGSSPIIMEDDFNKAMAKFQTWIGDSAETRSLKQQLAAAQQTIDQMNTKPIDTDDKDKINNKTDDKTDDKINNKTDDKTDDKINNNNKIDDKQGLKPTLWRSPNNIRWDRYDIDGVTYLNRSDSKNFENNWYKANTVDFDNANKAENWEWFNNDANMSLLTADEVTKVKELIRTGNKQNNNNNNSSLDIKLPIDYTYNDLSEIPIGTSYISANKMWKKYSNDQGKTILVNYISVSYFVVLVQQKGNDPASWDKDEVWNLQRLWAETIFKNDNLKPADFCAWGFEKDSWKNYSIRNLLKLEDSKKRTKVVVDGDWGPHSKMIARVLNACFTREAQAADVKTFDDIKTTIDIDTIVDKIFPLASKEKTASEANESYFKLKSLLKI